MTVDLEKQAAEAVREHGSIRKAAAVLGLPHSTVQTRARRAAVRGLVGGPPIPAAGVPPEGFVIRRNSAAYDADGKLTQQWIESGQGNADCYEIPAGHVVKGESVLTDANGNVIVKWTKTREGAGEGLVEALKATFANYVGAAPLIPPPSVVNDDLLTIYPLPDLHFGMLSWGRETGENYDLKIATDTVLAGVRELVEQSHPSRHAVLLGLGDYFHANDSKAATPASNHRLDVDVRWRKAFNAGALLATALVDLLAQKHEKVTVVFLPGNHDPDAADCLAVALALFYRNNERITVYEEPGNHWFHRFGKCLLGATHGHTMKPARMAMMMAADRAEDWGQTTFRSMFFGHIHHESALEVGPVRVESFSTPAAKDAFAAGGGWRSGRAMSALTFHREGGEKGRHRVNIVAGPATRRDAA